MARRNRRAPEELAPQGLGRLTPVIEGGMEIRVIQPMNATKAYICPGCNGPIRAGVGHLAVVPPGEPDLRRHWHTP